jgi:hypothetical protein
MNLAGPDFWQPHAIQLSAACVIYVADGDGRRPIGARRPANARLVQRQHGASDRQEWFVGGLEGGDAGL